MDTVKDLFPWAVMLFVCGGMMWLVNRAMAGTAKVIDALDRALQRTSGGGAVVDVTPVAKPAPNPSVVVIPSSPTSGAAPALPAPAGPFDGAPAWFQWALHEIGQHEDPPNRGPVVQRYIDLAHCGTIGDPWCAIFANAALESSSVAGTRSPSSQSFRSNANFVQLPGPALGAIAVFWRGAKDSGLGHVGFYRGENADSVWTLGGNENDMVQIEALPKSSATFGLIGYWWPKSVPLPKIGAVVMPAGSPIQVQSPPASAPASAATSPGAIPEQVGITATMFGGQQSAYGGPIDDNSPGVALPYRFAGQRPQVRVTNAKTGVAVLASIVDVGPWNTNDPYWQTGTRPESETGIDTRGRKTNGAGIDLTLAAAKAIGVDGRGIVNWQFVESPVKTT